MRARALPLVVILMTTTVAARQDRGRRQRRPPHPTRRRVATSPAGGSPVSLDRIRKALDRPPLFPVQAPIDQPLFRVDVQQRNRLQDILSTLDFSSDRRPAGGLYAAEGSG